jgi:ribosomal protein S18 acetylase RimI-like enzyme
VTDESPETFAIPQALADNGFTFRPEREEDITFLSHLFYTTRAEETERATDWPLEQRQAFLHSQFELQRKHYYGHFPYCNYLVLEHMGAPVGRLYLDMAPKSLDVLDISLLPQWRGRGVGGVIMEGVLDRARASGRYVGLYVERFNPAFRLYERLGFKEVSDQGVYIEMHWQPDAA